ncbi:MAG: phosphoribosylanthranilate isomerase [Treponema sp.]|nr:phosphoribosylanthranilate isomerase [Treponema sp.]
MLIKICGLFREEDIDFVNEARPDFAGFVFAKSPRQISAPLAQYLRFRLNDGIIPVGVFVNAPIALITELYHNGIISIAQLHGNEDESYITALKKMSATALRQKKYEPIKVIKTIIHEDIKPKLRLPHSADYILMDSGAGSGKTFDWNYLKFLQTKRPWFLAGGIGINNIEKAVSINPYAVDVSSGAETNGVKDREKILQLTAAVKRKD